MKWNNSHQVLGRGQKPSIHNYDDDHDSHIGLSMNMKVPCVCSALQNSPGEVGRHCPAPVTMMAEEVSRERLGPPGAPWEINRDFGGGHTWPQLPKGNFDSRSSSCPYHSKSSAAPDKAAEELMGLCVTCSWGSLLPLIFTQNSMVLHHGQRGRLGS